MMDQKTRTDTGHLAEHTRQAIMDLATRVAEDQRLRAKVDAINEGIARMAVDTAIRQLNLSVPLISIEGLAAAVLSRSAGLGFLDPLLRRDDLEEISLNPDGKVWAMKKSALVMELTDIRPTSEEVWLVIDRLLLPNNKTLDEARPSVDAKLIGFGRRARLKLIVPTLLSTTVEAEFPVISGRLFELTPVTPEHAINVWKVAPESVIRGLLRLVGLRYRVMVCGGTRSGKTALMSVLSHGIPLDARIVSVEDPQELSLPHQNVVTLEARRKAPGSDLPDYTISNGVDDAMRLAPQWVIVGEVRTGSAALGLFRAQMSDHPGLTTFHAYSPQGAVKRLTMIMHGDEEYPEDAAREMFAQAVDIMVQLAWVKGVRQVVGVWEVLKQLGPQRMVQFRPLWLIGQGVELAAMTSEREDMA